MFGRLVFEKAQEAFIVSGSEWLRCRSEMKTGSLSVTGPAVPSRAGTVKGESMAEDPPGFAVRPLYPSMEKPARAYPAGFLSGALRRAPYLAGCGAGCCWAGSTGC